MSRKLRGKGKSSRKVVPFVLRFYQPFGADRRSKTRGAMGSIER